MALMPKRSTYRKEQRGVVKGNATRGNYVAFGDSGLQSLDAAWITGQQIEAARIAISRAVGRTGRYWIRIFPHKPVTAKPLEVRMGVGKGEPEYWCAVVKPGTVLFEVGGIPKAMARAALYKAANKMPIRCRMVDRRHRVG
ncbi:MAG: 50S ribosomal protein L16 [Planctomycetes bacterium]|nr:50S ribosomal protein L16 [Planctomycetota bacterium]